MGGYEIVEMGNGQQAIIAAAEKALLDLIYLTPGGDSIDTIRSLRLQNLEILKVNSLKGYVEVFAKPKIERAVEHLVYLIEEEAEGGSGK